jgi:hypothetical protein
VRQCGGSTGHLAQYEVIGGDRLRPEVGGVDVALFGTVAPCASRLVERVNAGVSLVGWT